MSEIVKKLKKGTIFNILFIIISATVLVWYFIYSNDLDKLISILKSPGRIFLGYACLSMVVYWILDGLSLYMVSHPLAKEFNLKKSMQTSILGQLFNCITPFASGGQPIQAYRMVRYGVSLGTASSILLAKFIIFQSILTFYSLFVLVFRFGFFIDKISGFGYLVFLGFVVNTVVVLFLIGIGFFPNVTKKVLIMMITFLSRFKRIRDKKEYYIHHISIEMNHFDESFDFLKSNLHTLLFTSIIVVGQLTCFYLAPYFICLALNVPDVHVLNVITAGAFVLMISSFIPLPGASGGAEGSFYLFFGYFFQNTGNIGIAIFLWRLLTFYFTILIGIIFSKPVKY